MQPVQVELPEGAVQGVVDQGVQRFYSLPYAAPMTDERRFRAPEPALAWAGVRDASAPGPRAPQSPTPPAEIDVEALMGPPLPEGGDYLTLNVFAPDGATGNVFAPDGATGNVLAPDGAIGNVSAPEQADGLRPVMVFVHGGSFVAGSKDAPIYDGTAFARDGVVCVVINYRLGIEGFLPIEGAPTNLGLRDMIAALKWVQANIALFGGDPARVTLFGESGGAFCTAALMVSPLAEGLFHRAICQSGHIFLSRDRRLMQRVLKRLARRLKIKPDRDGFLSVGVERMLAAQAWVMTPSPFLDLRDRDGRDPSFGVTRFLPVHGDDVLPEPMIEALRKGAGRDVDLLIGTTREEANLFFVPGGIRDRLNRWAVLYFMGRAVPRAGAALRAYGLSEKGRKPGHVMTRAMTDLMFRWMARRTAELHQGKAWVYEFDWRSPAFDGELGAAHAVELPFVFDTLACASGARGLLGEAPPQDLADATHRTWIHFATTGEAPWPAWDAASRQVWSLTRGVAEPEPIMPAAPFLP